jgi:hypothetical protein
MKTKPALKKTKAKAPRPWDYTYWEGKHFDFTFTPQQALTILETIPDARLRLSSTIDTITERVRAVIAFIENIQAKPPDKTVRQQLTLLENQTNKLKHTLDALHGPTTAFLDRFTRLSVSDFTTDTSLFLTAIRQAKAQRLWHKEAKGGRPRNKKMRYMTGELVFWWDVHISMPESSHDHESDEYAGDFHHFAVAVVTASGLGAHGLDAVIERVVASYREAMEQAEKGQFDVKK